jgi:hypothetical protein
MIRRQRGAGIATRAARASCHVTTVAAVVVAIGARKLQRRERGGGRCGFLLSLLLFAPMVPSVLRGVVLVHPSAIFGHSQSHSWQRDGLRADKKRGAPAGATRVQATERCTIGFPMRQRRGHTWLRNKRDWDSEAAYEGARRFRSCNSGRCKWRPTGATASGGGLILRLQLDERQLIARPIRA